MAARDRGGPAAARRRRLDRLKARARACQQCDLFARATQTVFGDGPADARLMLVGEQPGDQEDREGEPFVGPAGRLLREALVEAGLDPAAVYFTNAVKHFKWKPRVIVALGATAASAVIGPEARVSRDRAKPFESPLAPVVTLTVHPSSILRAPDAEAQHAARRQFVEDLKTIKRYLRGSA